ncbi:hypothetical protein BJY24_005615 [Nocardia transvalensis]|uniref:Uncharacterized protein n=1 Tax=Nocardia transvalensis TaxID=37333 RepID=A0A7W9PJM8_9NOCA|nr:hypothetical protein [Nocardia transvalensis]
MTMSEPMGVLHMLMMCLQMCGILPPMQMPM